MSFSNRCFPTKGESRLCCSPSIKAKQQVSFTVWPLQASCFLFRQFLILCMYIHACYDVPVSITVGGGTTRLYAPLTDRNCLHYSQKRLHVHCSQTQAACTAHRQGSPAHWVGLSLCFACFAAIAVWTATGDVDHAWIIGSYFHYSVPDGWTAPRAKDISPPGGIFSRGDPMYVAYSHKKA